MSLFENSKYEYLETYFVLLQKQNRPPADAIFQAIEKLGSRYQIKEQNLDGDGFESMTIVSEHDFAGMDVTYVEDEEVTEQVEQLQQKFKTVTLNKDEIKRLMKLPTCNARFDVYHFEQRTVNSDDIFDPGALLVVLKTLSQLCDGIALVDSTSPSFM
jgi:hypothetical protein